LCAHALNEDCVINRTAAQRAANARGHPRGTIRHVMPRRTQRPTAEGRPVSNLIPDERAAAPPAFRVEQIHQAGADPERRQHGSSSLQHSHGVLLFLGSSDATGMPLSARHLPCTEHGGARRHTIVASHVGQERIFRDRRDAGGALASRLEHYKGRDDVVVLALPRGGVPVAHEVARVLQAPLDVFLVRKLGVPGRRELAMGAIASGGVRVLNEEVVAWFGIPQEVIDDVARYEQVELERREREYRDGRSPVALRDRVVLLIDDGLATGSSMKAAVQAAREQRPARIVIAVPVGAPESCRELEQLADEIVCARTPHDFAAVGQWYQDFSQTEDEEVRRVLHGSAEAAARSR
jgi:predicted phosphoribosyltransferase